MKKLFYIFLFIILLFSFTGCDSTGIKENIQSTQEDSNSFENKPEYIQKDKEFLTSSDEPCKVYYIRDVETQELFWPEISYKKPEGTLINHIAYFGQTDPKKCEYELLVFVNCIQHDFMVDSKKYQTYPFTLTNTDRVYIDLSIDISDTELDEIEYVFIQEPNFNGNKSKDLYTHFNGDLSKYAVVMTDLTRPFVRRIKFDNKTTKNIKYEDNCSIKDLFWQASFIQISHNPIVDETKEKAVFIANSKDTAYLTLTNKEQEETEIALIMMLNNKQIKFQDGNIVKYFKIPPNSHLTYKFNFPEIEEEAIFQFITVPKPFQSITDSDEGRYFKLSQKIIVNPC